MVVLALAMFVALSSCAVGCSGNTNSSELKLWRVEDQPLSVQLAAIFKEMESLKCEQTTLQQQHNALTQMHISSHQKRAQKKVAGTHILTYSPNYIEVDNIQSSVEDARRRGDPCFHYTVLDQTWRATNTTSKLKMCDRQVDWKGWYRLFYKGKSLQMPERCVPVNKCGTNSPLWLSGPHPRIRDGIVTRNVCGTWNKRCCAFHSTPIKVKKCPGNYYVYQFTKPTSCYLAYCADVNTLVCGRCRRNQSCVSRDKINWRCKTNRMSSQKIHFFASYPAQINGKLNRIKYSKVLVNVGRAFDRRTGVFRAPVKGIYQFFFSTQTTIKGLKTDLWLVINNYWVAVSRAHVPRSYSVGSTSTYMTFLRRGASVYVTHNCGNSWATAASMTITFGGSLLLQSK
ncbi:uncharacterized protein LOC102307688 isoform X1 [Haplochromis burtoni]|uniref:uncharacterized protein LOC102307688 isoform X1 n=1 Tax=Haplochromis burtoni TaxID=8153 RepID=UPI0003BD324F|nr:uncharacterized protein LOC102307688 isoform X1 [Haplochromis burtoni]XP_042079559.1 uncharacterized protein LOC102307688 isoform X1 [Haplochromis burtoni]